MGKFGNAGRTLLLVHLVLAPLLFCTATTDGFELVKVALLRLVALVLGAGGLMAAIAHLGRCGPQLTLGKSQRARNAKQTTGFAAIGRRLQDDPIGLGVLLYLASAAISTVVSISPRTSFWGAPGSCTGLATVLAYTILYFATRSLCRNGADARRLLSAAVVAAAVASAYALVQVAGLDPIRWHDVSVVAGYTRPFATLGHPNLLGAFLVMALPFMMYFAGRAGRQRHYASCAFLTLTVLLAMAVVVLTLSRGAWLALGGALVVMLVLSRNTSVSLVRMSLAPRRWIMAGLVLVLGTGVVLGGLSLTRAGWKPAPRLAASIGERVRHLTDDAGRPFIWRAGLSMFADRPLFGCGLDTFALAFQGKRTGDFCRLEWKQTPARAHNEVIQVLATQGLLGTLAVAVLGGGVVVAGRRCWRRTGVRDRWLLVAVLASITAFVIQNIFSFTVAGCGTLMVTLAAVLSRLAEPGFASGSNLVTWDGSPDPSGRVWRPVLHAVISCRGGFSRRPARRGQAPPLAAVVYCLQAAVGVGAILLFLVGIWNPLRADLECHRAELAQAQDPQRAVACLQHAVALDPVDDICWTRLGASALDAAGRTAVSGERQRLEQTARRAFDRAVDLVPVNGRHYANLGRAVAALAGVGLAPKSDVFQAFDRALELDPCNPQYAADAATAALELNDHERARGYLARGLELYPEFAPFLAERGFLALIENRCQDALSDLQESMRRDWRDETASQVSAFTNLASALGRVGQLANAAALSRNTLAGVPDCVPARWNLAHALELLGERSQALAEYRRILELCPTHAAARAALERLYQAPDLNQRGLTP